MRKGMRWTVVMAAALMILTACSQSKPTTAPAPASGNGSATQEKPVQVKKIKVASAVTPPNMVHIPTYVALDQGFFKAEGLDASIVSLEGGVGTAKAVISGAVDVAGTSADPIIAQIAANNGKVTDDDLIGIYTYGPRLDVAMVASARVQTTKDLKGKNLGIQEPNAFAHVLTRLVLAKEGIADKDVTFVSTSTAGRLSNLIQGKTDSAILHIEQAYKAVEDNKQLHTVANLWETDPNWLYSFYATTNGRLKQDPDLMERFVRAIIKTTRWMVKPENKARVVEIYMKYNDGFSKDQAERAYDALVKGHVWPVNEGVSKAMTDYTVQTELKYGIITSTVPIGYEQVYNHSVVDKVLQQIGRDSSSDL